MISVIICTYNPKLAYLECAIESILQQHYPKMDIDFFIVDNNSETPILELPFIKGHRIKVVVEKTPGLTAARECGVRHAKGEIIVYVDDDNILNLDYLLEVKKIFNNPKIGIISGNVKPKYENPPQQWFYRFEEMLALRKFSTEGLYLTSIPEYSRYFPIGAGMCIRRKLLRTYFASISKNNRIEGRIGNSLSSGEDIDMDFFAIHSGYLIGISGKLHAKHIIPAARHKVDYLIRLAVSSIRSTQQVNMKWKSIFGGDCFSYYHTKKFFLTIKLVIYGLLYPWKQYRILFHFHKELLRAL